ncbi:MAG: hypothetical protein KatS3mg118_2365 [Paracoccaceae bacterium]|nr:MAG: hypothetical protein KatS3mg118_2365 [Paracoccaceae bacterium]
MRAASGLARRSSSAYVDQTATHSTQQDGLGGDLRTADVITLGEREVNSRAYCAAFNFRGADQQKKVGSLSGGERNRVHLAKLLQVRAATCSCSTSPPTISTSRRCARSRTRSRSSPAARW